MDYVLLVSAFVAAVFAGLTNAVAGGGTLITFPLLTAMGVPAIQANITNTIALSPGYLSGTYAQLSEIRGQRRRLIWLAPLCITGGICGGILLLKTGEKAFREIIPFLILFASLLLAVQPVARRVMERLHTHNRYLKGLTVILVMFPAALYGGYFGAGVSVIIIAGLGLVFSDTMTRLNALKQLMSFFINFFTAVFFMFSGEVLWPVAAVMAAGSVAGGYIGGRIAGMINPVILRWIIVALGTAVGIYYLVA